ncbi:MAG: hypothetical protein V1662_00495 [Candidatus Omnitrophota bacterium]
MRYYSYALEDFKRERPDWEFLVFPSLDEQNKFFAQDLTERIKKNEQESRKTVVVFPVGPIDYGYLARLSNARNISLKNLVIFFMDEYCDSQGNYVDLRHPLSFRGFIQENFYNLLKEENRMPGEQLIFPDGKNPAQTISRIKSWGGIEVTYGGFGINGHLAFNDPPDNQEERTEQNVRYSTVRKVALSRETLTQNALAGTAGNIDIIPRYAVTLGMRELLSAGEIHAYLLRTWHSGVMRRVLFGPVEPGCPASYVQLHKKVRVCMPPDVLKLPLVNVTLNIGL